MKNQCSEKKISGRKYYDLILLQKNAKNDVLKFFFLWMYMQFVTLHPWWHSTFVLRP